MSAPARVETRGLWFTYPEGPTALEGVDLAVDPGELVALIGENGSGKTTLAMQLNGLLRPGRGQVLLDGEDIGGRSVGELSRKVGYLYQNPDHQIFSPSVEEEIAFGPRQVGLGEAEVRARTQRALEQFELVSLARAQPASLSFGLRRRVTAAAVAALDTPILVLDEPTTGLDWGGALRLMDLFAGRCAGGNSVLLISHDMRLVVRYASRCILLHQGRVLAGGSVQEVFYRPELLRSAQLEPPPAVELGVRLAAAGLPGRPLSVEALCRAYCRLVGKRRG